ncbi:MAG: serine/threonine-protein kinase, partial [Acidobacteriota bacterium]
AGGVVHRDLKPENIIRTPDGGTKVLDFGLARLADESGSRLPTLTGSHGILGTPAYMSPEQIRHTPIDARSDLFSIGALLYELVTAENPFLGPTAAATMASILEVDPPGLKARLVAGGCSEALAQRLDDVARRCLQKDPTRRFRSATALVETLAAPLGTHAVSDAERVDSDAPSPPRRAAADAVWWWQFHQGAAAIFYVLLLVPLWRARGESATQFGLWLFLAGVIAAVAAGGLRLHLWFAVRLNADGAADERAQSAPWIRLADLLFLGVVLALAALASSSFVEVAILLVAAAAAVLISFAVIEPATTKAAFGRPPRH